MIRFKALNFLVFSIFAFITIATPANAALKYGDPAPDFSTKASLGGKEFEFSLYDALKKGPVVLYFYPAAFTKGCTVEAHAFAEATDEFKKSGATVIGISHDNIETLNKFSVSECRNKFAVAADTDGSIIKLYDATMMPLMKGSGRVSYVIIPDHKILYAYSAISPDEHVANTLNALKKWNATKHNKK